MVAPSVDRRHLPERVVVLFWPNMIGYLRMVIYATAAIIALIAADVADATSAARVGTVSGNSNAVATVLLLFLVGHALDFFDGVVARRLGQCSRFGEVLDVAIDNFARGLTWVLAVRVAPGAGRASFVTALAAIFTPLEWLTFLTAHAAGVQAGLHWKHWASKDTPATPEAPKIPTPWLVQKVFCNGFRNVFGVFSLGGAFLLPLYLYSSCATAKWRSTAEASMLTEALSVLARGYILEVLLAGRCLCAYCECWVIHSYAVTLLHVPSEKSE